MPFTKVLLTSFRDHRFECPGALRPVAHRTPACRQRAHRSLQLAFARQKGGTMVLRIEDTDVDRSEARFEDQLIADLKWLGLDWDEGPDLGGAYAPYRQSDRLAVYREHAERLLSEHKAYLCFCAEAELQRERERAA